MGQPLIDETGNKYGSLTVISLTKDGNGRTAWLCKCDCGNEKIVRGSDLRTGRITTCGKGCLYKKSKGPQYKNEQGKRYGKLTVLYEDGRTNAGKVNGIADAIVDMK